MRSIRKGNTFTVRWSIYDLAGDAYDLTGLDISLYVSATVWRMPVEDFTVSGNTIQFTFEGADQVFAGVHSLILYVNEGGEGQQCVDTAEAFCLVESSDDIEYDEQDSIEIEVVELTGVSEANGYFPTATVERTEGGALVTITDRNGTTTAAIYDGEQGEAGAQGEDGAPGADGVGFDSVTTEEDGTMVIALTDGDTVTVDLNHDHPTKPDYVLCASEADYNAIEEKDGGTLYLIPDTSS